MDKIQQIFEKHTLYDIKEQVKIEVPDHQMNADLVIIFNDSDSKELSDKELELLTKILSACKLDIKNIPIMGVSKLNNFIELEEQMSFTKMVVLDTDAKLLGIQKTIPLYSATVIKGVSCVFAESLEALQMDTSKKTKLWSQLKIIFKL